ncbi:hypothetical protein FDP41_011954 [Naegleria fowleri]|uniref:Uncharacterized protein n=1 Tax=Naegleria fowleri TaxID=5763 RepID=A0A6A5BVK5_NAEFO|nr:uncharacterized protein FDP41_011954 [Naegleria fowleri]KAF0982093.1 hypothetical protein FDP41_011954 [Naegleria fowleri]
MFQHSPAFDFSIVSDNDFLSLEETIPLFRDDSELQSLISSSSFSACAATSQDLSNFAELFADDQSHQQQQQPSSAAVVVAAPPTCNVESVVDSISISLDDEEEWKALLQSFENSHTEEERRKEDDKEMIPSFQELGALLQQLPSSAPSFCANPSSSSLVVVATATSVPSQEDIYIHNSSGSCEKQSSRKKKKKKGQSLQATNSRQTKKNKFLKSELSKRLSSIRQDLLNEVLNPSSSSMVENSHYPPKISPTSYVVFEDASSDESSNSSSFELTIHYFKGPKLTGDRVFNEHELELLSSQSAQVIRCSRHSVTSLKGLLENHFGVNRAKHSIYIKMDGCSEYHMLYCQKGKTENVRSLIRVQDESNALHISTHCLCLNKLSNIATPPLEYQLPNGLSSSKN